MLIIRFLAILMIFLIGSAQTMEHTQTATTSLEEQRATTLSRDTYRRRLKDGKREMRALFEEIRSAVQAKEDILTHTITEIEEKYDRLNQLLSFSKSLPDFYKEFTKIKALLDHPEKLFVQTTSGQISLDRKKHLASFEQAIAPLDQFIKKWDALTAHAGAIIDTANQSLQFEGEWGALIGKIINRSQKVDGAELYKWIQLFHLWQKELSKSLTCLKSNKILIPDYQTIEKMIRLFQESGKILWKIARFNVADIPANYIGLERAFFDGDNPVKLFLCQQLSPAIGIPNALRVRLLQVFEQPEIQKISSLKKQMQPLRHVGLFVGSLKKLFRHYNDFKEMYLTNLESSEDISTPWANGVIDKHEIRVRQSMARKALCLGSNGPLCFGVARHINLDAKPPVLETSINNLRFITRNRLPISVREYIAWYWLEKLFGLPGDPLTFISLKDIPFSANFPKSLSCHDQIYQKTQEYYDASSTQRLSSKEGFAIVQRQSTDQSLAEFLIAVAKGQESLKQLDPPSVGMQFMFTLLTGSSASAANFRLIHKEKNLFELKRVNRDFAIDPSRPGDSLLHPRFYRYGNTDGSYKHALLGGNIFCLFPNINQPISDTVKAFFRSNDILLIISYWLKELKAFDNYLEGNFIDAYGDALAGWVDFSTHPDMIRKFYQNFQRIVEELRAPTITYKEIFKILQPHEYQCYKAVVKQAKEKTQKNKARIFFNQAMPMILEDLSDLIEDMAEFGGTFSYDGETIGKEDLEGFEQTRLKIIEQIKEDQGKSCEDLIHGLPSERSQKFFCAQYAKMKERGIFDARTLLKAWKILQGSRKPVIYEDLIEEKLRVPWERVPIANGYIRPGLAQEGAKNITSGISDMISQFIACANITSKSPTEAAEILLHFVVLKRCPNTIHPSWKDWAKQYTEEFLAVPIQDVQSFFQSVCSSNRITYRALFDNDIKKNQEYLLQASQMKQLEGYDEILTHLQKQGGNDSLGIAGLFEQLWLGTTPEESVSDQDRQFLSALCDWLHLRVQLRPASRDKGVLSDTEKWVKLFRRSKSLSPEMRRTAQSHHPTLLCLSWLAGLNQSGQPVSFPPGLIKGLLPKLRGVQSMLRTGKSSLKRSDYFEEENQQRALHDTANSLRDAATEVFHAFDPEDYLFDLSSAPQQACQDFNYPILQSVLELASHFPINVPAINHNSWNNPQVLSLFVERKTVLYKILELLIALQLGCDVEHVELTSDSLKITDLKRENFNRLCQFLDALSDSWRSEKIKTLDLSRNQILSLGERNPDSRPKQILLKGLIASLIKFKNLETLILRENPIYDPSLLITHLTELQKIDIRDTYVAEFNRSVQDAYIAESSRKFIGFPTDVNIKTKEILTGNQHPVKFSLSLEERQRVFDSLYKSLTLYGPNNGNGKKYKVLYFSEFDSVVSVIEQLSENFWDETLAAKEEISADRAAWFLDTLNTCTQHRKTAKREKQIFSMRQENVGNPVKESAFNLAFALACGLPSTMVPEELIFHQPLSSSPFHPSSSPSHLKKLTISGETAMPWSLRSLAPFSRLTRLALTSMGLVTLDGLPGIRTLQFLDLSNNKLVDVRGLKSGSKAKFPKLYNLKLLSNEIENIDEFPPMEKLFSLDLSNNKITNINGLCDTQKSIFNFKELGVLNLAHNQIGNNFWYGASELFPSCLKKLDVSFNHITTFEIREWYPSNFCISHNNIPTRDFHKIYHFTFGEENTRDSEPKLRKLRFYQEGDDFYCKIKGKEKMKLMNHSLETQRIFKKFTDKFSLRNEDKEFLIELISNYGDDYLNSSKLVLMPQRY